VHPSLFDSFGVVVLEAIAAGCVVIGSRIASFPELVTHGSNGFLVDLPIAAVVYDDFIHPYSRAEAFSTYLDSLNLISLEEQIYSYMKDVLADEVRRRRMMALSLGHFNSKFAPDIWIREMCTLLAYAFPDCFYNEPSPKARLVQGSTSE
jgi:glycosyltransferase involved in cell wall biosynthesis